MNLTSEYMERGWLELKAQVENRAGPLYEKNGLDVLVDDMTTSHIEKPKEDDTMKAVREALEACVLVAATTSAKKRVWVSRELVVLR